MRDALFEKLIEPKLRSGAQTPLIVDIGQMRVAGISRASIFLGVVLAWGAPAYTHPHVFIDGGVEFVIDSETRLHKVIVTWRYDALETLFILTEMGLVSTGEDGFTTSERQLVEERLGRFPDDFDGSVHLTAAHSSLALEWPKDLEARLVGDRLEITFVRDLREPYLLAGNEVSAAFYERTYFFAFSMTDLPRTSGPEHNCKTEFVPFTPGTATQEIQETLAKLGREETPASGNVGYIFADVATLSCDRI